MRGWDSISQRAGSWCFYHHSVSSPRNSVWSQPKNPCSGQGCPRAVPQGPLVLPEAPGAAHFPGKMCAELTERSCCQAQPPGAPEWAQPWHLCTLIFPHLTASLPPSLPPCWKDLCHPKVLVIYPGSTKPPHLRELKFLRQTEVSLQTHYKSKRVFKWPRCCSFSPSALLILLSYYYFFSFLCEHCFLARLARNSW